MKLKKMEIKSSKRAKMNKTNYYLECMEKHKTFVHMGFYVMMSYGKKNGVDAKKK